MIILNIINYVLSKYPSSWTHYIFSCPISEVTQSNWNNNHHYIQEPDCQVYPWQWNTIHFFVTHIRSRRARRYNGKHTHSVLVGQYGWVYLIKKSKVYFIVCVSIYMYIYIYQIAVDSWASVDLSLSLNGYILISFLHRVNQHHRSCPTNTILLIILFLIPWLWWDVTPRWSLCAVWCAWFPKLLEPPHPLSNYVSWIYRPDSFVKPISTLTCSYI